ncbi:MAG: methionine synthase [Candidatus Hodarchaeota archaeon]
MDKAILGATLGSCVHVAGLLRFLTLAKDQGYQTFFLPPPNTIPEIISEIQLKDPDIVALSYRLTPETANQLFTELKPLIQQHQFKSKIWIFGGTTPVCKIAQESGIFSKVFNGSSTAPEAIEFLRKDDSKDEKISIIYPQTLRERIILKQPFPLLRAHFGLPSLGKTLAGLSKIADAKCLDVISIGPDQNFQESYFRPQEMNPLEKGAGGVPIRSKEDLLEIYKATRRGNYPLVRCYAGTRDLVRIAELLVETINNAWSATPIFWYSELDGRGKRKLEDAITENLENFRWHAAQNIPLESNESHHWSLRDAPDSIAVATAYLAAYNAKKAGIHTYVAQYMMNTPLSTSPRMDLAKMLAKIDLIESLHDEHFHSIRQVRTGLFSFPEDPDYARAQLVSSIQTAMHLRPKIVHVVSYCEATHAATANEVIESCKLAIKTIDNCLLGIADISTDSILDRRCEQLKNEALLLIETIRRLGEGQSRDPLCDPVILSRAVEIGLLDAPHLQNNPLAKGEIQTRMINGACITIDPDTGEELSEINRIRHCFEEKNIELPFFNELESFFRNR